jgi:hypothetical protein
LYRKFEQIVAMDLEGIVGKRKDSLVRKTFELQDPLALEQLCRLAPDRQQREEMFTIAHTA